MLGNNSPLVSVIIPTYGRADLLSRAINSVLTQTYENIEVIVVNDNNITSEHYHQTMIALYPYSANPKVKVISDGRNVGGSLARNKGIELSQGEYISFLDDDDYYYQDKIKNQVDYIFLRNADICICNMDILKKDTLFKDSRSYAKVEDIQDFLINGNCFTPMILCKKSVLVNIAGFEESPRFQDHILILKMLKDNYKICKLDKSLFVHNDHDGKRITKNKIGSYDVRWFYEEKFLEKLDRYKTRCVPGFG